MPLYDFKCEKCSHKFEEIVNIDISSTACPKCGDVALKVFSGTRFVPFRPYVEYNIGDTPIEITSKGQLERELKTRGLAIDNRPIGLNSSKTKRSELRRKAEKAKEFLNAT